MEAGHQGILLNLPHTYRRSSTGVTFCKSINKKLVQKRSCRTQITVILDASPTGSALTCTFRYWPHAFAILTSMYQTLVICRHCFKIDNKEHREGNYFLLIVYFFLRFHANVVSIQRE